MTYVGFALQNQERMCRFAPVGNKLATLARGVAPPNHKVGVTQSIYIIVCSLILQNFEIAN